MLYPAELRVHALLLGGWGAVGQSGLHVGRVIPQLHERVAHQGKVIWAE